MLQRCILRELLSTFSMSVLALLSLILISRGLQMRDLFMGLDFSAADIALLFFYMMPMFLIMVLPISCMVSVFLTFLRMSTDRELIAVKTGGVSIYQMLKSPALFSFLCMCLAVFISLHAISWGMNSFRSTILNIANTRAKVVIQPGVFNKNIFGLTLFARKVDPVSGKLLHVIFEDYSQDVHNRLTVLAPEGDITTDTDKGALVFNLYNGRIYRLDAEKNNISILEFEEYRIDIDLANIFSGVNLDDERPKEMSWEALTSMSRNNSAPDERYRRRVEVEIQKRWSLPAACLVLGIFALPLACAFEGVRRQLGIVLALLMFLLYYSVYSLGLTMSESGYLSPMVGLWFVNVLFALVAVIGLHLTHKERAPSFERFFIQSRKAVTRQASAFLERRRQKSAKGRSS
ncbi:MAG: LPS export ABC transporter permease LptF [Desulfovibrio sp.]|nr:LPS export ABC transporter permease LptF [Desulfovibrio sp.]